MSASNGAPERGLVLGETEIKAIRRALLIGLDSYGEIERLENEADLRKILGKPDLGDLNPRHPTCSAETVSEFAAALRYLES